MRKIPFNNFFTIEARNKKRVARDLGNRRPSSIVPTTKNQFVVIVELTTGQNTVIASRLKSIEAAEKRARPIIDNPPENLRVVIIGKLIGTTPVGKIQIFQDQFGIKP
jgi:hypothetical protein